MANRPTITLGICLAAGLAAGIGLARPSTTTAGTETGTGTVTVPASSGAAAAPAYGQGVAPAEGALVDPAAQDRAPAPAAGAIRIAGFDFGPPVAVSPGAAITVDNDDGVTHTLTAEGGAFDTGDIGGGGSTTIGAPIEAGTYRFFCTIHPSMRGSLTVAG